MNKMRLVLALIAITFAACSTAEDDVVSDNSALGSLVPETHCASNPSTGPRGSFRHFSSNLVAALGSPRHRGIDLVASASASSQTIRGDISYGVTDKALEDEWVQLYACINGGWTYLGPKLTDGEGRFALSLSGTARLPAGLRDLFVSVFGDRTSTRFTAVVGPSGTQLAVTDIDGTLTSSENTFTGSVIVGGDVATQPSAAAAITALRDRGFVIVYLTARPRYFTAETRSWLAAKGFPPGALRLAPSLLVDSNATANYKLDAIRALALPATVGVGNRASDAWAYYYGGIAPARSFMKRPEFASELAPWIDGGWVVGFDDYSQVLSIFANL